MIKEIRERLKELGLNDLPDGKQIVREGKEKSKNVTVGKTLFMEKYGVSSEREYKERMKAKKEIMFHFQYGLTDFEKSADGLRYIYEEATKRGHRIDRYGLTLDRVMGLPSELRKHMNRETGLKLEDDEWAKLGQVVPMQPHFGDYIVNVPAAEENLINALKGGGTTVGNFSAFFTYEYPNWSDTILWTERFIRSMGIASGLRDKGVMIHSNLDDGFGGMFYDRASIIGMAMFDYYVVNNLIGAKLAPAFGNTMREPLARMSMISVLHKIHGPEIVGTMVNGDTLSSTRDFDRNYGATSAYLINDIVMQMYKPTGHAVQPMPVTESVVIPTPDDNLKAQMLAAQLAIEAEHQYEVTDFKKIEEFAEYGYQKGKCFFERMMEAFSDVTDIEDPYKLCYGIRLLGPNELENMFCDETPFHGTAIDRQPYIETPVYKLVTSMIRDTLDKVVITERLTEKLSGKKAVIASTDVHKMGKMIVHAVLKKASIEVVDIGCQIDPYEVVESLKKEKPEILILSTYNGFALSYAKELKKLAKEAGIWGSIKIFMGGRLNEDAGQAVPINVTEDLAEMGIQPSHQIEGLIDLIDAVL
ncbi:MAG: cobalamin B12-binding domain-containing protein [Clostridiales bacterium]|nr:cobalamin B12-binding domain-containing protein [Clostridiales bacterium]